MASTLAVSGRAVELHLSRRHTLKGVHDISAVIVCHKAELLERRSAHSYSPRYSAARRAPIPLFRRRNASSAAPERRVPRQLSRKSGRRRNRQEPRPVVREDPQATAVPSGAPRSDLLSVAGGLAGPERDAQSGPYYGLNRLQLRCENFIEALRPQSLWEAQPEM
jgi:hypothetical protein